jgi:hypothetical protein
MPCAHFNNTAGTYSSEECLTWGGFSKNNYPDGVTVEFIAKVDSGASFCQFAWMINAYNFGGISYNSSNVGSYLVVGTSPSFQYTIGYLSNVLTNYESADAWHHYCYTADFKNEMGYFFLDGNLVCTTHNSIGSGILQFHPCCISTSDGLSKSTYGYCLAQVAVWDYPKYTDSFAIPRKPLIAL